MKEIIQKAIEFGIKQERERAEFMTIIGLADGLREIAENSLDKPITPQQIRAAKKGVDKFLGNAHEAGVISTYKAHKAPKQPKPKNATRAPRQKGVMKMVKSAISNGAMSLNELVEITGAKEGTVRAALRTLTANGFANVTGGLWHAVTPATTTNSGEAHTEAA